MRIRVRLVLYAVAVATAGMLLFGVLSGSFLPAAAFPGWLQALSKLTPNAWGLEGFAALAVMAVALFGAAALVFSRTRLNRAA